MSKLDEFKQACPGLHVIPKYSAGTKELERVCPLKTHRIHTECYAWKSR